MKPNQLIINGINISPVAFKVVNPTKQTKRNDYKLMATQLCINIFKQLFCKHNNYVYNPYNNQLSCCDCGKLLKK
jgi:hypothetical protein